MQTDRLLLCHDHGRSRTQRPMSGAHGTRQRDRRYSCFPLIITADNERRDRIPPRGKVRAYSNIILFGSDKVTAKLIGASADKAHQLEVPLFVIM